jgi:site-specific DNA-cytosine methylase
MVKSSSSRKTAEEKVKVKKNTKKDRSPTMTNKGFKALMAKLETTPTSTSNRAYIGLPEHALRVGSDCAGLMSESLALHNLGVKHTNVFVAEVNPTLLELLKHKHPEAKFTADLMTRNDSTDTEQVDIYTFGAPCQPWSPAGKQQGNKDKLNRNFILWKCISYIHDKLPRAVISENSHAFAYKKFTKVRHKITSLIRSYGYNVWWKVLNTKDFGIPQHRKRFYLVAIKNEALKRNFKFPAPTPACLPLNTLLEMPGVPGRPRPPATDRAKFIKRQALKKFKAKQIVPSVSTPCVIDINASPDYASQMAAVSPTLTATRCTQNGHYIALRKGMMRFNEMCRLQGMHPKIMEDALTFLRQQHTEAHSLRVLKHAIGNAMSVNVLMAIMVRVLPAAGLVQPHQLSKPSLNTIQQCIGIAADDFDLFESGCPDLIIQSTS